MGGGRAPLPALLSLGLGAVGAKRVFMLTPYIADVAAQEVALLEHYGYELGGTDSFDCYDTRDIAKISTAQVEEMILRHAAKLQNRHWPIGYF